MDPTRFDLSQTQDAAPPADAAAEAGAQARPADAPSFSGDPAQPQPPNAPASAEAGEAGGESPSGPDTAPRIDPAEYERLKQQNQQFQQTLGQVENWARQQEAQQLQQQVQQRYDQRVAQAESNALNMSPQEAVSYMAKEMKSINSEWMDNMKRAEQAMEQRIQQERRTLGMPLWVKQLVQEADLPADAEAELLALGQPELIERQLPFVRQRYQTTRQLQERLDQMARSLQANQHEQAGAGVVGGTTAPPSLDIPDNLDPDQKAMLIYQRLKGIA